MQIFGKELFEQIFHLYFHVKQELGFYTESFPETFREMYTSNDGFFVEVNLQNLFNHPAISADIKISQIPYKSSDNRVPQGTFHLIHPVSTEIMNQTI